jgi:hypothetical protein
MFERLIDRASRAAASRARVRRGRLAERMRAATVPGVTVSEEGERVVLAGRGLTARMATDAKIRWLVAESKDER